jgi:hypothetical protein
VVSTTPDCNTSSDLEGFDDEGRQREADALLIQIR